MKVLFKVRVLDLEKPTTSMKHRRLISPRRRGLSSKVYIVYPIANYYGWYRVVDNGIALHDSWLEFLDKVETTAAGAIIQTVYEPLVNKMNGLTKDDVTNMLIDLHLSKTVDEFLTLY